MEMKEVQVVLFLVNYIRKIGNIHHLSLMIMMMMVRLMMIEIHSAAVGIMFLAMNAPKQNVLLQWPFCIKSHSKRKSALVLFGYRPLNVEC